MRIPILQWEFPLKLTYLRGDFEELFQKMPREVEHAIRSIIGDGVLRPRAPRPIYQTQILSILYSNIYDVLPEYRTMMKIEEVCINPPFVNAAILDEAISGYSLHGSKAWVGGIIPIKKFDEDKVRMALLDTMRIGLWLRNRLYFEREMVHIAGLLPEEMVRRAFALFDAIIVVVRYCESRRVQPGMRASSGDDNIGIIVESVGSIN